MKTGAELVNFKNFNAQNKQSISDFQTLRAREINDVIKTSSELFNDKLDDDKLDDETTVEDYIESEDELDINGRDSNFKHYYTQPYGSGIQFNENIILNFSDFNKC